MNMRLFGIYAVSGCLAIGLSFLGWEVYRFRSLEYSLNAQMNKYAEQQINNASQQISDHFQKCVQVVRDAAQTLSSRTWDKDSLNVFLKSIIEKQQDIQGVTVAFEPYKFDPSQHLYGITFHRKNGRVEKLLVNYDYTLSTEKAGAHTDWYNAIKTGEGWTEPYWGTAVQRHIIVYSGCFFAPDDKEKKAPIGVVNAYLYLDYVRKVVNELALGKKSFGFVVSQKGFFVAYPVEELYRKGRTLLDLARDKKSKRLEEIYQEILIQKTGKASYNNELTGQPSIIFYKTISGTNLIFCIVFIKDELFGIQGDNIRHNKIKIILSVVLCLLLAFLFWLMIRRNLITLISVTVLISLILVGGINCLWFIQRMYVRDASSTINKEEDLLVFDKNTIDKVIASCADPARKLAAPDVIKTGILLKTLEHISLTQVRLAGFIWQRYSLTCNASVARDFFLPQCHRLTQKMLLFKEKRESEECYIWWISGIFDQDVLISKTFPLDEQNVDILLDHPSSLNQRILLVPDLESYQLIASGRLPGLDERIQLLGWILEKSFFVLQLVKYNVDIAGKRLDLVGKKYNLNFTLTAKRKLLGILIMNLLPLLLILLLLFINILLARPDHIMTNISLTSGIFVGIIFAHSALRRELVGSIIFYLESFYIVLYFFVILIVIDLLLYARNYKVRFVMYRDNLLAKILFWPSFLLTMFLITGWMFW